MNGLCLTNKILSVLIAQADEFKRTAIKLAFTVRSDRFSVAGEAATGAEAIEHFTHTKPDLVILGNDFQDIDGIKVARALKAIREETKILFLTNSDCDDHIFAAFSAGADAYCCNGMTREQLAVTAIAVAEGTTCMSPAIAQRILHLAKSDRKTARSGNESDCFGLTNRELQVLGSLVEGASNAEIAGTLGTSEANVNLSMWQIFQKLGLFLSRRIMQAQGGTLTVDSTEGQGSTFICAIPLGANNK